VQTLNDADAAGIAEMAYGAGKGERGLVLMLTFGTGIGSALFIDGTLVPNTEFGHIEVGGHDGEKHASASAREREDLSYPQWAKRVDRYLDTLERSLWPDLIIVGGGVSKKSEKWVPLLSTRTRVVPDGLLWPDLVVLGGGVSKKSARWLPLLEGVRPEVRPAKLLNDAGIVGAALAAEQHIGQ
jgi:polyphosphate glucokinase